MKLSKYVLKIPYKSKIILYNTVNDMIVLCDYKKSKEILKEYKRNDFQRRL